MCIAKVHSHTPATTAKMTARIKSEWTSERDRNTILVYYRVDVYTWEKFPSFIDARTLLVGEREKDKYRVFVCACNVVYCKCLSLRVYHDTSSSSSSTHARRTYTITFGCSRIRTHADWFCLWLTGWMASRQASKHVYCRARLMHAHMEQTNTSEICLGIFDLYGVHIFLRYCWCCVRIALRVYVCGSSTPSLSLSSSWYDCCVNQMHYHTSNGIVKQTSEQAKQKQKTSKNLYTHTKSDFTLSYK